MTERQLAFDLPTASSYAREDFLVAGCNRQAWSLVESWPNWPDRALILTGPAGAGKTHLGRVWAETAGARRISGADLRSGVAAALAACSVLIEDADRGVADEAELFHLLNLVRSGRGFVVLTARKPPDEWALRVPDLLSRLRLAPLARLDEPNADLMRAILTKLFVDRQLQVEASVVDYLALRLDRSFESALEIVETLDREALALARRVTRALAADVLSRTAGGGASPGESGATQRGSSW